MADAKAIPAGSQSSGGGALPPSFGSPLSHQNRLLASLPQSDMALLAPSLQVISVPPGAVLQFQEDPIEYLYFPHEGLVSLRAMTPDGHTIQATSIGRAGAVCPALKLAVREALLTAVALGRMRLSRISVAAITMAEQRSETINHALHCCREALLLQLRQNIICDGLHTGDQRVSRWILETADRLESDILPIPVTQEYVAQCLGVRRTTVTLLVRALQEAGAIRWGRSHVAITDRGRIEATACSCYQDLRERMSKLRPSGSASAESGRAD